MGVETPRIPIPESHEKKTNTLLNQLSKKFFELDGALWSSGRKQKYVEYGGLRYEDGQDQLYFPLNNDFEVCSEYNGRFRDEDSSYLCILKKSKQHPEYIEFKIFQKWIDAGLKKKNLVFSTSILVDSKSKQKKYSVELNKTSIKIEDGYSIFGNISSYLNRYFFEEELLKREKIREEQVPKPSPFSDIV